MTEAQLNDRMCILSRAELPPEELIRFVTGPDGAVVADLRRRLPGRGAHVEARRTAIEEAVRKNLFRRAFKRDVIAGPDLPAQVDGQMARSVLGALGLARKAGQLVTGSAKVEAALRSGRALAALHASGGAADGWRKLSGAATAAALGREESRVPIFRSFTSDELGLALGGVHVIHAAVLAGDAGAACVKRLRALAKFRGEDPSGSDLPMRDHASGACGPDEHAGHSSNPCGTDDRRGTTPAQEAEA